jgi:HAD superfamily hydrolase (TIGR01509 family)
VKLAHDDPNREKNMGSMHRILTGVLFDIDGTLVESNEAHALSWVQALRENGHHCGLDEVCPLIGMGGDYLLPTLLGISSESEEGKKLSNRKKELFFQEHLPHVQPTPGAHALIQKLRELGLRLAVATSASDDEVEALLKICHANDLIPEKTSKTEAGKSKPSPNVVEVALEKIQTFPGQTLMLGDTPYDIEAALKAGVQTIAFRCGGWSDQELPGALAYFDHPQDLLENLEFSPLAPALLLNQARRSSAA